MSHPLHAPVHHVAYCVPDLDAAIPQFVERFGAGPFFRIAHVPLETVTSRGEPGVYDHSSAFGACGDSMLEVMEFHAISPERVSTAFAFDRPALHHVGYVVPSLDDGVATLEARDVPEILRASLGEISFVYLDTRSTVGHHVELLADVPAFHDFFTVIRDAARDWDGETEPVRAMGG
jgi:Glyoxalase/Bleomycin resistance protein/Dioxygenase superfamily